MYITYTKGVNYQSLEKVDGYYIINWGCDNYK